MKNHDAQEVVIKNANVLTVDDSFSTADTLLIRGDMIVAVGESSTVMADVGRDAYIYDLEGRTVIPGIVDGHPHMDGGDAPWRPYQCLANCTSISEIQARIKKAARQCTPGTWLVFRKLADPESVAPDHLVEKRFPRRQDLDAAAPEHPVFIRGTYSTPSCVNSLALKLAGVGRHPKQPERLAPARDSRTGDLNPSPGGCIEVDEDGYPTGILHDYDSLLSRPTTDSILRLIGKRNDSYSVRLSDVESGAAELSSWGVTAAHEGHGPCNPVEAGFRAFLEARSKGSLSVRVNMVTNVPTSGELEAIRERFEKLAYTAHGGAGDDWLRFDGVGVTLDGPGGAGDSRQEKVADWTGPDDVIRDGVQRINKEKFRVVCFEAAKRGIRLSVKADGESMVGLALEAFEEVDRSIPLRDRKWVLFHTRFIRQSQMPRLKALGVLPVTCASFIWNDAAIIRKCYGEDIAARVIPFRSYLEAELPIANGSDTVPKSPFFAWWLMTNRTGGDMQVMGPEQGISRREALRVLTNHGARLLRMENRIGSIESGKYADLVVLPSDPLAVAESELAQMQPLMTMAGGRIVYQQGDAWHA